MRATICRMYAVRICGIGGGLMSAQMLVRPNDWNDRGAEARRDLDAWAAAKRRAREQGTDVAKEITDTIARLRSEGQRDQPIE